MARSQRPRAHGSAGSKLHERVREALRCCERRFGVRLKSLVAGVFGRHQVAGSRAVASVPLRSTDGQMIGMISTHHRRRANWTDRRIRGLQSLANSTGRLLSAERPR